MQQKWVSNKQNFEKKSLQSCLSNDFKCFHSGQYFSSPWTFFFSNFTHFSLCKNALRKCHNQNQTPSIRWTTETWKVSHGGSPPPKKKLIGKLYSPLNNEIFKPRWLRLLLGNTGPYRLVLWSLKWKTVPTEMSFKWSDSRSFTASSKSRRRWVLRV